MESPCLLLLNYVLQTFNKKNIKYKDTEKSYLNYCSLEYISLDVSEWSHKMFLRYLERQMKVSLSQFNSWVHWVLGIEYARRLRKVKFWIWQKFFWMMKSNFIFTGNRFRRKKGSERTPLSSYTRSYPLTAFAIKLVHKCLTGL